MAKNKNTNTNNITELVFILDESGSMAGLESDTIGGFNSLIRKQREEDGRCFVSTILFNNASKVIHDRVPLEEVEEMTGKDYVPSGCTALIDAIGGAIKHVKGIHKYARPEDVPAHTMFVITTDGLENASKKYSSSEVKKMIEQQKEGSGWEFLFVGANIDSVETAKTFGIDEDRAVNYHADKKGTKILFGAVSDAVCCLRSAGAVPTNWCADIAEDFEERK